MSTGVFALALSFGCSTEPTDPDNPADLGVGTDTGSGDIGVDAGKDAEPDVEEDVEPDVGPDIGECVADCFDEGFRRINLTLPEVCLGTEDCLNWAVGEDCADGGEICDFEPGEALCVEEFIPMCDDGNQNDAETDIGCGGACHACVVGEVYTVNGDCMSGFCDERFCAAASCEGGVRNAAEGWETCDFTSFD